MKALEDYAIRHGEIISANTQRLAAIEEKMRKQELETVREEGTWAAVLTQLQSFDKRLGKIEGLGNKGLTALIVALIGAVVTFIVKGGLA